MGLQRIDDPRLLDAIEHLYAVFGRYPARPVDGCPCCVTREDQAALAAAPLRALGEEHLSRYGNKALTTWGETPDFKHFLPRLLELAAAGADWPIDLEHQARKLEYAGWRTWPTVEREAVVGLFSAAFRAAVVTFAPASSSRLTASAMSMVGEPSWARSAVPSRLPRPSVTSRSDAPTVNPRPPS